MAAANAHPGDSDRELGRNAQSAGYTVAYPTISKIKAGTYHSRPSHKTPDALAWLASVSRETGYTAAGEYLSLNPFADERPPEADKLTPKQRDAVIGVIRTMLDPGLPTTGTDEVSGATKQAGAHSPDSAPDDDQILRQNPIIATWSDTSIAESDAEVVQQQLEMDDDLYSRWLHGEDGFDEVTTRRFRARADEAGERRAPDETAAAARQAPSRDIEEHDRSLQRREESQDDGGDEPR